MIIAFNNYLYAETLQFPKEIVEATQYDHLVLQSHPYVG